MVSDVRSSRWSPIGLGRGLVLVGAVFLLALVGLLVTFTSTSVPVAPGAVYQWDSDDAIFVQPADGELSCVVHTAQLAARVTVHRASGPLIPGELVDRPAGTSVTLSCEQPARVAAGPMAQLYPAGGPAGGPYVFGGLIVLGAALWLLGRQMRRRP